MLPKSASSLRKCYICDNDPKQERPINALTISNMANTKAKIGFVDKMLINFDIHEHDEGHSW